jgi:hypothetical protein
MKFESLILIAFLSNAQINSRKMEGDRERDRKRDRETEKQRNRRLNPVRKNQKCWIILKLTAFVHHLENRNFERFFESEESKR